MKASEVLRAARGLIERPEAWTQRAAARSELGEMLFATDSGYDGAVCWCPIGAIHGITLKEIPGQPRKSGPLFRKCRKLYGVAVNDRYAEEWNDKISRKHPEVLAAFDRAIELAEAEETETARGRG